MFYMFHTCATRRNHPYIKFGLPTFKTFVIDSPWVGLCRNSDLVGCNWRAEAERVSVVSAVCNEQICESL